MTEYPVNPVKASDIVDTNGAGDAFVGGKIDLSFLNNIDKCDSFLCEIHITPLPID